MLKFELLEFFIALSVASPNRKGGDGLHLSFGTFTLLPALESE
jgi:hypothetical protein